MTDSSGPSSGPMPLPLEIASGEDAFAAFFPDGKPDPATPLGTAFLWWKGLLDQDQYAVALARLTWAPEVWDFQQTAAHLDGWSMMQRVYDCEDAPGQIAYVRFMRDTGHTMRAFADGPLDELYVLTLVHCEDDWWRVWGYSKDHFPPASQVFRH